MTRDDCEIISKLYYSNCLIEAIRAKIKNPKVRLYFCLPYRMPSGQIRSSHVVWDDGKFSYDFSDQNWSDTGKFWQYFWYKGCIRRWSLDFAKSFSIRRNRMAKKSWRRRKYRVLS